MISFLRCNGPSFSMKMARTSFSFIGGRPSGKTRSPPRRHIGSLIAGSGRLAQTQRTLLKRKDRGISSTKEESDKWISSNPSSNRTRDRSSLSCPRAFSNLLCFFLGLVLVGFFMASLVTAFDYELGEAVAVAAVLLVGPKP